MDLNTVVIRNYFACLIILISIRRIFAGEDGDFGGKSGGGTRSYDFTCAHCGTSKSVTTQREVTEAIEQFLDVRGSVHFPYDAIDPNCNRPRNISLIKYRRKCMSNFCYSVTFRDNQGTPITLRGCAEYYMPVASLKTSYCKKLTKSMDITECVCKGGDICSSAPSSSTFRTKSSLITFVLTHVSLLCFVYFVRLRWS